MVLLRGSRERGQCSTHGLLSGLGAIIFLERFLGAAVSSWHQNSSLNPISAARFLNTLGLRKWRARRGLGRTYPVNVTAFSPPELHIQLGPLFTIPFPCSLMPSSWPLGCSSAQSTGIPFPLGYLLFPLGWSSGNTSVSEMKGPILCCQPQEHQRISFPRFGPCRDDSGWTGTGQVPSGCH